MVATTVVCYFLVWCTMRVAQVKHIFFVVCKYICTVVRCVCHSLMRHLLAIMPWCADVAMDWNLTKMLEEPVNTFLKQHSVMKFLANEGLKPAEVHSTYRLAW